MTSFATGYLRGMTNDVVLTATNDIGKHESLLFVIIIIIIADAKYRFVNTGKSRCNRRHLIFTGIVLIHLHESNAIVSRAKSGQRLVRQLLLEAQVGCAFASAPSLERRFQLHQVETMVNEKAGATDDSVEEVGFVSEDVVTSTGNYLTVLTKHSLFYKRIQFHEKRENINYSATFIRKS